MKSDFKFVGSLAFCFVCFASPSVLSQGKGTPLPVGGVSNDGLDSPQAVDLSMPLVYRAIKPCRLADTRPEKNPDVLAFGGLGVSTAGERKGFWGWAGSDCADEAGRTCYERFGGSPEYCGIPSSAAAVHVNISVVSPGGPGYMRVWPNSGTNEEPEPTATIFSWRAGFSMTNAANISICSSTTESRDSPIFAINGVPYPYCHNDDDTDIVDFWVKIYSDVPENIVIDALGYYEPLDLNLN